MSYDIGQDDEQREILLGFIEEGREMIDEAEPLIIELEQSAENEGELDLEMINTVFRLFHSLKGGAGFLDLTTISGLTHEAETLLDMFRKGEGQLQSHHIDLMNRSCDFLRSLLDQIETEYHDHGKEEEAAEIKEEIRLAIEVLKSGGDTAPAKETEAPPAAKVKSASEADQQPEPAEETSAVEAPMSLEDFQLTISPEMVATFVNEGSEQLEKAEEALLGLEKQPDDSEQIQQAFRAFHSFKGNSGFLGYGDMEKLSHGAESVLDLFREGQLEPTSKVINHILEIIDFLRSTLIGVGNGKSANIPATPGLLHLLEDYTGTTLVKPKKQAEPTPSTEPESVEEVAIVEPEPEAEPPVVQQEKPAPKSVAKPTSSAKPTKDSAGADDTKKASTQQRQSVRVDVEKLDVLLDLVGELVISEAMVAQNPDLKDVDIPMDRFEKAVMQLDKITRDLQDISMSIRMTPLSGTFRRMVRLVRDLSQKAGKKVDLKIIGEETEVDKTVIEQITDPLVHIIRNAIDHGLETPDDRVAAGKGPTGSLTLEAKYVGGEVWINIVDDGRGLNKERILNKAIERGLLDKDPSEYRDDEIWQIIFLPGFSTAEKVTDVSGRGVGMDVVRRNIENIRGKIDIRSTPGGGSVFTLRIPLTLAIIDGMIFRVGNDRYTLSITTIRESLQVTPNMITQTMDGQEIIRVRENLFPVIRLHELLDINRKSRPPLTEGIIMIVEDEGRVICLFVDELLGQQQIVIKGLSEYIGNHPCISGCTILGDGDISLILDVAGTISFAEQISPSLQVTVDVETLQEGQKDKSGSKGGNGKKSADDQPAEVVEAKKED